MRTLKRKKEQMIQGLSIGMMMIGALMMASNLEGLSYLFFSLKEKLGVDMTYASEPIFKDSQPDSVFAIDQLLSIPTYGLGNDLKAAYFDEKVRCHKSISESRCQTIVQDTYEKVPTSVFQDLQEAGFDIILTGNNIRELVRTETGWDAGWSYQGVTFPNYAGYVRIWSSSKGGSNVLIHEIGHAYDYANESLSSREEFNSLYRSESFKLFLLEDLYRSNEREYFAESFKLYFTHPWRLKWFAPQTYAFFEALFPTNEE